MISVINNINYYKNIEKRIYYYTFFNLNYTNKLINVLINYNNINNNNKFNITEYQTLNCQIY